MASVQRNAAELGFDKGPAEDFKPELLSTHAKRSCSARWRSSRGWSRRRPRAARGRTGSRATWRSWPALPPLLRRRLPDPAAAATSAPTDLNRARLWLVEATRTVLANGLALLGVSAPERM